MSKYIFKNPGSATSIFLNSLKVDKKYFLRSSARSIGVILLYLAKINAALQDISEFSFLGGSSTVRPEKFFGIFNRFFFSKIFKALSIFFLII